MANASELKFIDEAKKLLASGEKVLPHLTEIDGEKIGYYPIVTEA